MDKKVFGKEYEVMNIWAIFTFWLQFLLRINYLNWINEESAKIKLEFVNLSGVGGRAYTKLYTKLYRGLVGVSFIQNFWGSVYITAFCYSDNFLLTFLATSEKVDFEKEENIPIVDVLRGKSI